MSSDFRHDESNHIAGEPADEQNSKDLPPLKPRQPSESTTPSSTINKRTKIFRVIKTISIIATLIISTYCFLIINSLEDSTNGSDNHSLQVLVRTEGREADLICRDGGADILIGNDVNGNGILEEREVTSATRLCHGQEGLSGPQGATGPTGAPGVESLVTTNLIEPGNASCFYGGLVINGGLDLDANGFLDDSEITSQEYVCNGQLGSDGIDGNNGTSGHSALIERITPPPYLCASGTIINFAIDNGAGDGFADDGIIQENEIIDSLKICSQPLNYGPISDLFSGVSDSYSSQCDEFTWSDQQQLAVMSGSDGLFGCELWLSAGTLATTERLVDLNTGAGDSSPGLYLGLNLLATEYGDLVLFDADSGTNGRELWASDFTTSGTVQLTGYTGDGIIAGAKSIIWMNGLVFTDSNNNFMWTNGSLITELFDSPFISQTNQELLDVLASDIVATSETSMLGDDGGLWFSAQRPGMGFEMHHLSNSGILTSWDLNDFEDSSPDAILPLGNTAIVVADDGINGRQLVELNLSGQHRWLTSLTIDSNGEPTSDVAQGLGLNLLDDKIIFDAQTSSLDSTIWSYDLFTETASELSQLLVAPGSQTNPVIVGGRLWFDCITASTASELCASDGTSEGTMVMHEFQPGIAASEIRSIVAFQDHVILLVNGEIEGQDTGHCLWSVNTSSIEVSLLYDPWSGVGNNSNAGIYGELVITTEIVMFIAEDGEIGHELHLYTPAILNDEWLIWR